MQSIVHMYMYIVTCIHWKKMDNTQRCDYLMPRDRCGRKMCSLLREAVDNSRVKMSKNIRFRQLFLSIRGEISIFVYELWLFSRGGGQPVSKGGRVPPLNEALHNFHDPPPFLPWYMGLPLITDSDSLSHP